MMCHQCGNMTTDYYLYHDRWYCRACYTAARYLEMMDPLPPEPEPESLTEFINAPITASSVVVTANKAEAA